MKNIRKFILYLCIIIPTLNFGQDWQCYQSGITSNYINKQGYFRTIQFDSITNFGDYTYYMNFKSLVYTGEYIDGGCLIPGPSWIGKYMMTDNHGNNYFFTKENDTIHFRTNANLGESWIFALNATIRIEAFISSTNMSIVLGVSDSIKTISFRSFNNNGNTIFHPLNSVVLNLSKNHGLINSLDFYNFSLTYYYGPDIFNLTGISDPLSGLQNLTRREVFNFSPGDVFHTKEKFWNHWGVTDYYYRAYHILESTWAPSGNSVIYRIDRFTWHNYFSNGDQNTYTKETINQTYVFDQSDYINIYPEQVTYNNDSAGYFSNISNIKQYCSNEYNFRRVKSSLQNWWQISYNCIIPNIFKQTTKYYIEGCGEYYSSINSEDEYHQYGSSLELQYYSKGSDTWGTPFDTKTWGISGEISENQFYIYPNPVQDMVNFDIFLLNTGSYRLDIYSITGSKLDEINITNKSFSLSVSQYTSGVYFLKLYNDNELVATKKMIVY
jgi:hypothetical protein